MQSTNVGRQNPWTDQGRLLITSLIARFMGPNMRPIWGQQDPGGPHVGPMSFAIWDELTLIPTWDHVGSCEWHRTSHVIDQHWHSYSLMPSSSIMADDVIKSLWSENIIIKYSGSVLIWYQLEQLEHLHSENTPTTPPHDYPYYGFRCHVITRQSQSYKFQKFV